ncbi:LOW QUALITY PROTEIN: hypothetical protein OSB04_006648 [Centaurea solstitialis]|uniref:Tf2-1-like SH3-like domain-containing protein n=1 Tax=Centaurea solstitialis TaxID=347529 RepID=A0AA38U2X1_9ASTR|nr:LOW QUALITY PROTEIN: hypothetical protein OSB04_006648 [Centaurea solstitialis]
MDALGRKSHNVVMRVPLIRFTVATSLLELIRSFQVDAVKEENQKKERIKGQLAQLVSVSRGLLTRSGCVWVLVSCEVIQILPDEAQRSKFPIHPGTTRNRDLKTDYGLPGMKRDVACCIKEGVARHGVPVMMISDRVVWSTSRFGGRIQEDMDTRLQFSTAFHPQTDGQSERTIQTSEDMLRACQQFPYQYQQCLRTRCCTGRDVELLFVGGKVGQRELGSTKIVQRTMESMEKIRERLRTSQSCQKSYANKRRWDLEFNEGDDVLMKVLPWNGVLRFRKRGKLNPSYIGPFKVIACVGKVAYRIELPSELSQLMSRLTFRQTSYKKINYVERPIAVMETKTKTLRDKEIG